MKRSRRGIQALPQQPTHHTATVAKFLTLGQFFNNFFSGPTNNTDYKTPTSTSVSGVNCQHACWSYDPKPVLQIIIIIVTKTQYCKDCCKTIDLKCRTKIHRCNEKCCQVCREVVSFDHKCYMQKYIIK